MYAITTTSRVNRQVYEPEFNEENHVMPKLNERKAEPRVQTFLNLPQKTREELESAIGHGDIKTLHDAVIEAARLLAKQVKKTRSKPE